jgi:glycine/serine hydroxymethyltransferase
MRRIAGWIGRVLDAPGDTDRIDAVRGEVRELCKAFPLYAELAAAD